MSRVICAATPAVCARTAVSAQEALAIMSAAPGGEAFQMALLDVMMPEMDGIELARRIKTDPARAKVAVVFVSSVGCRSDFSVRLLGLDIGGRLMKPVPESSLSTTPSSGAGFRVR